MLLNAIFLPSFLRVHPTQDPDHLLARRTCKEVGSTLEMQSVLVPLSNGKVSITEMLKRITAIRKC